MFLHSVCCEAEVFYAFLNISAKPWFCSSRSFVHIGQHRETECLYYTKRSSKGISRSWSSRNPVPFLKFLKTWWWQTCQPSYLHYYLPDVHSPRHDSRGRVHKRECVFLFIMWWHCRKYCIYIIACFTVVVWILVPWQKCFNFHWGAWTVWSINMENFAYTVSNLCALHL